MSWTKNGTYEEVGEFFRDENGWISKIDILGRGTVYVNIHPTMNCQVASIGCFNNILGTTDPKKVLKALIDQANKCQLIIDINSYNEIHTDKLFAETNCKVVLKNPYISTNDSNMIMYLVDIRNFKIG